MRTMYLALFAAGLLASAPAFADDVCGATLGHGWPPATENYGTAVETLLAGGQAPRLMLTRLPARGVESAVMLVEAGDGWRLRFAEADERVMEWTGTGDGVQRQLRTAQVPDVLEIAIPASLAERMLASWKHMSASLPPDRAAPYGADGQWTVVLDGDRIAGTVPDCDAGRNLVEQVDLLIQAVDESESKQQKRWRQISELLDGMDGAALAGGGNG